MAWAADAHVLQDELRIGPRRNLRRDFLRRLPAMLRRLNLRIVAFGLRNKIGELLRLSWRRRILCPRYDDGRQNY